ncbi:MAG: hypothetical protein RR758_03110 [Burkholderiaceae bacterium]
MSAHYAFSAAEIDAATTSALGTLAWCTPHYGDDGEMQDESLDSLDAEWSDAAREAMRVMLDGFMSDDRVSRLFDLLALYGVPFSPEQIGHNFVLTANGHGTGFWDRDYRTRPKAALDALTEIVRPYGEIGAYQSDAGALEIGF